MNGIAAGLSAPDVAVWSFFVAVVSFIAGMLAQRWDTAREARWQQMVDNARQDGKNDRGTTWP